MRLLAVVVLLAAIPLATAAETPVEKRVDALFAAFDKPGSPGCALGVIRDGQFVYRRGYGLGSLELGTPLTSRSVFYMASVSKQFTAASVVLAAQQGYLNLDDDVRKYIPELPDYGTPITLRQMLHHTSGLRDILTLLAMSGRDAGDVHTKPELLALIARQTALNFKPGDEFLYSNTNYFLLAEVIQRATGSSLAQFAAQNIFGPLKMEHTLFHDDRRAVVPGRVPAYSHGPHDTFKVDWALNFDKVGDGGLMSSVDDLLHWDQNFYHDQLGKGVVTELETRGVLNSGKEIDYALGLEIGRYRGLPTVEHSGGLFGYATEILRFPAQHFTVIALCNVSGSRPERLALGVADLYLKKDFVAEDDAGKQPVSSPQESGAPIDPQSFAGSYESTTHRVITFVVKDGVLAYEQPGAPALKANGPGRFAADQLSLVFDAAASPAQVKISLGGEELYRGSRFTRPSPEQVQLADYAGHYHSDELDADYKLAVEGGQLKLHVGWLPEFVLGALKQDEFLNPVVGVFVFRRDAANHIAGFQIFDPRVRGVSFDRVP
jgi:CubicO group peptidase (beta-lactamase class C family)